MLQKAPPDTCGRSSGAGAADLCRSRVPARRPGLSGVIDGRPCGTEDGRSKLRSVSGGVAARPDGDSLPAGIEAPKGLSFFYLFLPREEFLEPAVKRLVLVDKKNRVCGDTAAFLQRCAYAWACATTRGKPDIEGLAHVAARLLDESLGKTCRAYKFSTFESNGDSDGYFIFDCDCYQAAPTDLGDPAATVAVMTSCFYVGYVRRDH